MTRSPVACSGLMYCGVPSESPVCVTRAPPALLTARAMPKSAITGCPACSSMFSGFMSRWITPCLVRVLQRARERDGDPYRLVHGELLLTIDPTSKGLTFDEWHHVEQQPVGFAAIEQRQEVGVLQIGGDLDLGEKPLYAEHCTELRLEHLERDVALVLDVVSEVDGRHAAFSELTLDGVAAGE